MNGEFLGINSFAAQWESVHGLKLGGHATNADVVRAIRERANNDANRFVMASKKMRKTLCLVGVGRYLHRE